ncbi:MAG: hypothetical protein R8J41_02535 [Alphaproteobacteria bacterium]|nr:hypothetical protein [Alphaproteobacteria bacterium]
MRHLIIAGVFVAAFAAPASAEPVSKYSDINLDTCPQGQDFGDEPAYEAICPGPDGWELRVMEGDLRFWVEPRRAGEQTETHFQTLSSFNNVHTKAEWRGEVAAGSFEPYAMILRYFIDTGMGEESGKGNVLVVTKVPATPGERSCHIGYVDAKAVTDANAVAQQIADTTADNFDCEKHTPLTVAPGEPRLP